MIMNMREWCRSIINAPVKKAVPILSFPCVQLQNITVSELICDSDRQAEGMKLVADRCAAGASVAMMDLSVEAEAFGATVRVSDDEVPTVIGKLLQEPEDADTLQVPAVGAGRTGLYVAAIAKACQRITDRPVFAGTIGPFSLAGRLMGMSEIMMNCFDEPEMVHTTMTKATDFLIAYIRAFRDAGANGVCIAEPAAGLLSPDLAEEFVMPYTRRLIDAVQEDTFAVMLHNCGNSVVRYLDLWQENHAMAYHFGNAVNMEDVLKGMPSDVLVMGNVDPAGEFRHGTPDSIRESTRKILEACSRYPNFVISSGCDIPPASSWKNIDAFFSAVDIFYAG